MSNELSIAQVAVPRHPHLLPSDALLERITDAVIVLDTHWCFTYVNRSAARILRRSADELLGKEIWHEFPESVDQPFFAAYHHAFETQQSAQLELFYAPLQRWFEYRIYPSPDGVAVLFQEVTARKALELQLAQQAERTATLAEFSAALAAAGLDYDAVLALAVRRITELLGDGCAIGLCSDDGSDFVPAAAYHADDAYWDMAAPRFSTDAVPLGGSATLRAVLAGEPVLVAQPSGPDLPFAERQPHSLIAVPLRSHGRILGAALLIRDRQPTPFDAASLGLALALADRAAPAIESAQLYMLAQTAVAVREQFLSIAAHELRTPLATLLGYVFLLERKIAQAGAAAAPQTILDQMTQQGQRLDRLVNALLDVARLQNDIFTVARHELDLVALVRGVVDEQALLLTRHTLHLQAPASALPVHGDPERLAQVLHNVLHNAVKYSPAGGPVLVSIQQQGDAALIAVRDQGIGIPEEARGRLFEQFYRASNVDPKRISGLGVGLYVASEIIARHAGTIAVDSVEGHGSTFTIRLPLVVSAPHARAG